MNIRTQIQDIIYQALEESKTGTISFQSISAPVFITEKIPNLESF